MIELIQVDREDVLALRVEGRIEKSDIERVIEAVERTMMTSSKPSLTLISCTRSRSGTPTPR